MGCKPATTREDLIAVVATHAGDVHAAARSLGINTPALRQRLLRAGLRREYGWTVPIVTQSPVLTESLAVAVVDLTIENESTRDTLARAEAVIDRLTAHVAAMAQDPRAYEDSKPRPHHPQRRAQFLAALDHLRAAPLPNPAPSSLSVHHTGGDTAHAPCARPVPLGHTGLPLGAVHGCPGGSQPVT